MVLDYYERNLFIMKQFTKQSLAFNNANVMHSEMDIEGTEDYVHSYNINVAEYASLTDELLSGTGEERGWADCLIDSVLTAAKKDLSYPHCAISGFEMHLDENIVFSARFSNGESTISCEVGVTFYSKDEEPTYVEYATFVTLDDSLTTEIIKSYLHFIMSTLFVSESEAVH